MGLGDQLSVWEGWGKKEATLKSALGTGVAWVLFAEMEHAKGWAVQIQGLRNEWFELHASETLSQNSSLGKGS